MTHRPKIVLLGMLTKMPVGGVAWLMGQYIIGFERLGFEVYYIEAHARTPSMFVTDEHDDGTDRAAAYLDRVMGRFGLSGRWAFQALHADGRCVGMSSAELAQLYRDAALVINMHGGTVPLPEHAATGRLVLLSTDPVELELEIERRLQRSLDFVDAHAACFTWGLNYGNPDCLLPWADEYQFVPSPPPIVLDLWDTTAPPPGAAFTTIGNWRQDWREVQFEGERYGWSKHREFLKVIDLPARVGDATLELALSSASDADRDMLRAHGWRVEDGLAVSSEMDDYRRYIAASRGEFTVAKDQNVRFRSGWFSERSACYLASGRPVIMQDTGFGNYLAAGDGLLPFTDLDGAAAAVERVSAADGRHQRAARDIAAAQLSHDVVLPALLDHVGIAVQHRRRPPAPAPIAADVPLVPISRRPLALRPETECAMRQRPVPVTSAPVGEVAVSIVIVVLDNLVLTRMAIEGVLATTDGAFEIVVVDNGSQAETRRYLNVAATRNGRVRLIRNETNRGFAPAVNQGLAAATGDVLVILNNDVVTPPGWLDGLVAGLDDPAVGLIGPVTNRCGNEAEIPVSYTTYAEMIAFVEARRDLRMSSATMGDFDLPVATMFCVAMRRATFEVVGPLDEQFEFGLFEDDDYSRRVRDAGYRVVCTSGVFVHHFGEGSLGQLAADGRYGDLFAANRTRFERKWNEVWCGHGRTPDPAYAALIGRVRAAVAQCVPAGAPVLVVSRGDDQLVARGSHRLGHFPRLPDGGYLGHHPADDTDAIEQLEAERRAGARYLVIPATSMWWLDYYAGFARHLSTHHSALLDDPETAVIYALNPADPPDPLAPARDLIPSVLPPAARSGFEHHLQEMEEAITARILVRLSSRIDGLEDLLDDVIHPELGPGKGDEFEQRCRALLREHVPRGRHVLVTAPPGATPVIVAGRPTRTFASVLDLGDEAIEAHSAMSIARLESLRASGSDFLLVVPACAGWFGRLARFADHVVGHYELLSSDGDLLLFDLRCRRTTSRALSAVIDRAAAMLADDLAVLDWTGLDLVGRVGAHNVFAGPRSATLPHLDASVPIVLIDDMQRLDEATRVASVAVISVRIDRRPVSVDLHAPDGGVRHELRATPTLGVVVTSPEADRIWCGRLREALSDQNIVADITAPGSWPEAATDLIAVADEGILPLPGCVQAARLALGAPGVGAVATKLFAADGTLEAAGMAVLDSASAGIAAGSTDVMAPWHEYVRDTSAAAGLLLVSAEALATIRTALDHPPADQLAWAAAIWAAGMRVVYQPEAGAVRVADPRLATTRAASPPGPLDAEQWRDLLAGEEPGQCWKPMLEVVR